MITARQGCLQSQVHYSNVRSAHYVQPHGVLSCPEFYGTSHWFCPRVSWFKQLLGLSQVSLSVYRIWLAISAISDSGLTSTSRSQLSAIGDPPAQQLQFRSLSIAAETHRALAFGHHYLPSVFLPAFAILGRILASPNLRLPGPPTLPSEERFPTGTAKHLSAGPGGFLGSGLTPLPFHPAPGSGLPALASWVHLPVTSVRIKHLPAPLGASVPPFTSSLFSRLIPPPLVRPGAVVSVRAPPPPATPT